MCIRDRLLPETNTTALLQQAKELFENALSEKNVTTAVSRLKDKTAIAGTASHNKLLSPSAITDTSNIHLKQSSVQNIERVGEQVKLRVIGQVMHFTAPLAQAVETIVKQGSLQLIQLTTLEPDQRIALAEHLLYANVIEVT